MKYRVFKIVSTIMGVPAEQLTEESSPDTIEKWDSLKHMNLILALEEEFNVQFTDEQIIDMRNIKLIIIETLELINSETDITGQYR